MSSWHSKSKEEVLKEFQTSEKGLSNKEASLRLEKEGENIIKETFRIKPLSIFFSQFRSILAYILLLASLFSFLLKDYLDASVILFVVIFNASVGFLQQYKAEKSIAELKKILIPKIKVMREDRLMTISSKYIVPGDIVILSEGDRVVADCRIISLDNLEIDEAILTGESVPIIKTEAPVPEKTILAERKNMLYAGTSITNGSCKAIVLATGMKTEFGKIAGLLQDLETEETPMQKKMDKFAKQISLITIFLVSVIVLLGILSGMDKFQILLTSVVLLVSAIPEGLPAVVIISLAFVASKLAKSNVILRRLSAGEALGGITVICSDKTGTITEEKMTVKEIFSGNNFYEKDEENLYFNGKKIKDVEKNKEILELLKTSVLCNNARFERTEKANGTIKEIYEIIGEPTESALVLSALELGINRKKLSEQEPRIKEFSFNSKRKMMSILRGDSRKKVLYSKGASNVILSKCSFELLKGEIVRLTEKRKKELQKVSEKREKEALRVLGFAFKHIRNEKNVEESGLIFCGFIGMLDPPRKEVKGAIETCQKAGINVKMITGDSEITAREIARQVGIHGDIINGEQLSKMNDSTLGKEISNISIFARISPEQKLRIVETLKFLGENVAITGDGINDSLALKRADIGIAMGIRGSEVSREVSDLILMDDNFASIVKGIHQGRALYDNTKKITKFLLAVNFSEILLIAFAIIFKFPLPFLPIHLLWMNLVTDLIPSLSLIREKEEDVMSRKPLKEKSILDGIFLFVMIAGIITFISELLIFLITLNLDYPIEKIRTIVLTSDVLFEMFFIFTCRSSKPLSEIGIFSNRILVYAFSFSLLAHLAILYTPLSTILKVTPLGLNDWMLILPFALSGIIIFEIAKYFRKKRE